MSIATDLATFIQQVGDHVFIEAEGKPSTLNNFITTYNSSYSPSITLQTDGIICLEEDANKWGLELRLYLHFAPTCIHATKNTVYRDNCRTPGPFQTQRRKLCFPHFRQVQCEEPLRAGPLFVRGDVISVAASSRTGEAAPCVIESPRCSDVQCRRGSDQFCLKKAHILEKRL